MTQADRIINGRFGGIRPAARHLGIAKSTVGSWVDSGFIPSKHHELVMKVAREKGIALTASDFFGDAAAEADHAA